MKRQARFSPTDQVGSKKSPVAVLVACGWLSLSRVVSGQAITEFTIPNGGFPGAITAGPDGNLWFTKITDGATPPYNPVAASVGRITPSGVITEFPIPVDNAVGSIATGPDGNLWLTEPSGNKIGRFTTAGVLTEFAVPTASSLLSDIAPGPDGNLWFVEQNGNNIGRISPTGTISEFPIPTAVSSPGAITAGPDGNLWFTEQDGNRVGRITTAGQITEFAVPTASAIPHRIATGSDGNLWFAEGQGQKIARITPSGVITEFPVVLGEGDYPFAIAAGPDGNLWFTGQNSNIGRITTAGVITEFGLPTPFTLGNWIVAGPDGAMWFTEQGSAIGRITVAPCGGPTTLCLNSDRFLVETSFEGQPPPGVGTAVKLTGDTGYFWFFDPSNVEVVIKVLNGCSVNGHYWVFVSGLTDVLVNLTVQDSQTGATRPYTSPSNVAFQPIQDTAAFPCP